MLVLTGFVLIADTISMLGRTSPQPEPATGENGLIAEDVEIREALRKLDLLSIDGNGPVGFLGRRSVRQVAGVDRQEPAHAGPLEFEIARRAVKRAVVHGVLAQGAEDKGEHVVEVHADVRRNAARLGLLALPGHVIPKPARGDVGQVHVVDLFSLRGDPLLERDDGRVQTQLQDREDALACVGLQSCKAIDVPGIEHQRLLADGVPMRAEREANMRIVQVVRRADADIVNLLAAPPDEIDVAVEALELGEEARFGEKAIDHADRIGRVERGSERASRLFDGSEMTGRDIARRADERERFPGLHIGSLIYAARRP